MDDTQSLVHDPASAANSLVAKVREAIAALDLLIRTASNQFTHIGHTAVKVNSMVAYGVRWSDFSITKCEGTVVKQTATPEGCAPLKLRLGWIEFESVGRHPL